MLTAYDYAWLYSLAVILFGFSNIFVFILAWSKTVTRLLAWVAITTTVIYIATILEYFAGGIETQELAGAFIIGALLLVNYFGVRHIYLCKNPNTYEP